MAIFIQHKDFVLTFLKALGNIFSIYTVEAQLFSLSLLFLGQLCLPVGYGCSGELPFNFHLGRSEKNSLTSEIRAVCMWTNADKEKLLSVVSAVSTKEQAVVLKAHLDTFARHRNLSEVYSHW